MSIVILSCINLVITIVNHIMSSTSISCCKRYLNIVNLVIRFLRDKLELLFANGSSVCSIVSVFRGLAIFLNLMKTCIDFRLLILVDEARLVGALFGRVCVSAWGLIIHKRVICVHMIRFLLAWIGRISSLAQRICIATYHAVSRWFVEVALTLDLRLDALLLALLCLLTTRLSNKHKIFLFRWTFCTVHWLVILY